MTDKKELPKLTPQSVRDWVRDVECYHPVGNLYELPFNASLPEIAEAFQNERSSIQGIAQELTSAGQWDAMPEDEYTVRLTRKMICNEIALKYGIKPEYISMDYYEGTYHYCGKLASLLSECELNTYTEKLNMKTLEEWVSDFSYKVDAEVNSGYGLIEKEHLSNLNQRIDDIFHSQNKDNLL